MGRLRHGTNNKKKGTSAKLVFLTTNKYLGTLDPLVDEAISGRADKGIANAMSKTNGKWRQIQFMEDRRIVNNLPSKAKNQQLHQHPLMPAAGTVEGDQKQRAHESDDIFSICLI